MPSTPTTSRRMTRLGNLAAAASPFTPVSPPLHPLDPQPHPHEFRQIYLGGTLDPGPLPDLAPNLAHPQSPSVAREDTSHGSLEQGVEGGSTAVSFSVAAARHRPAMMRSGFAPSRRRSGSSP
jgi:hypothetical protein